MNDLSIVSHIKNEIHFLEQFWKHIHSYSPIEIIIIDTGSIDGTWEKLLTFEKQWGITYRIQQIPHYTGQVEMFNKVIEMATSTWVMKIDADELYRDETIEKILTTIEEDKYDCISIPTIHHFLNADLYFDVLKDVPDFHQRVFKKDVFNFNSDVWSKNHGSIYWTKEPTILGLGMEDAMYHYTMLRPLKSLLKRSIINYYIDIDKTRNESFMKDIEVNTDFYIDMFRGNNTYVIPAWQTVHTPIPFNTVEDFLISEFLRIGKRVDFPKPQDLIVHKIANWPKAEEAIKHLQ